MNAGVLCTYTGRRKPGFPAGHRQYLQDKISGLCACLLRSWTDTSYLGMLEVELQMLRGPLATQQEAAASPQQSRFQEDSACLPTTHEETSEHLPESATLERTRKLVAQAPPADLAFSAISFSFRHIHPWLPFLGPQRVFAEAMALGNPPPLHYALFGVSIPYSSDPRLDRYSSDCFWMYCKRRTFVDILEEPSLQSLEALTILVLDLSGITNGPQVWGALSLAVKFSAQLRFMVNRVFRTSAEDTVQDSSENEDTRRKRLFWAIYALDSYITITTANRSDLHDVDLVEHFMVSRKETWRGSSDSSPFDVGDDQEERSPCNNPTFATPSIVFSYQLELLDLARRVHNFHLDRPANPTHAQGFYWGRDLTSSSVDLSKWSQSLPTYLGLNYDHEQRLSMGHALPELVMLHAYYHALVIHLHGLAAYPPDEACRAQLADFTYQSQRLCCQSIASLVKLASGLDTSLHDRFGWPFIWSLWTACRYLLVCNRTENLADLSAFQMLLDCLKLSTRHWQIGTKYWRLLSQAATELAASRAAQLAGWRRELVAQHVLSAVTDLRIPTSDVEDQTRPDPMVRTTAIEIETTLEGDCTRNDWSHTTQGAVPDLSDSTMGSTFEMPSQLDDSDWYNGLPDTTLNYQP